MPKPDGEGQLTTRRDAEHRGAFCGQRNSETRARPSAELRDEEPLVCREPFRGESRRVLMEPQRLIGQPVCTDDHRGQYVGCLEDPSPLRYHLAVTGEHDRLGRIRREVHRDPPTTVVLEALGDELSCDGHRRCLLAVPAPTLMARSESPYLPPSHGSGGGVRTEVYQTIAARTRSRTARPRFVPIRPQRTITRTRKTAAAATSTRSRMSKRNALK